VVLPTYSENFGIVVAEALAAGRPVLTTTGTPWGAAAKPPIRMRMRIKVKTSDEPMNLEKKGCGVICEPGREGVRVGLEKMLKMDEAKREEMGKQGKEWMKKDFSWEKSARRLSEGYQKVLAKERNEQS
jgi:glycosyltransferase involved in cell wall biosynthesis